MLDKLVKLSHKLKLIFLGMRKFSIMLLLIVIPVWMRLENLMTGDNLAQIFTGVGAAFMAGNMIEHVTDVIKKKMGKDK